MSRRNRKAGRRTGSQYVLPQVGTTDDGKKVLAGVYEFHETYGMPLPGLFSWLADHEMVPDWIDFYQKRPVLVLRFVKVSRCTQRRLY